MHDPSPARNCLEIMQNVSDISRREIKNCTALLAYFLPQFTTNSDKLKINIENMPFVQRHNNSDFRTYLAQLAATKELKRTFDKPPFYTTMVRGDIFYNKLSVKTNCHTSGESNSQEHHFVLCIRRKEERKMADWQLQLDAI